MAYFFDLEDFETTCRAVGDALLKSANQDNLENKASYFEIYKKYDGYKPSQETIVLNDDGTIGLFVTTSGSFANKEKQTVQYGGYCCKNRLPFYIELAKTQIGVFEDFDTSAIYWDAENQTCRWKKEPEYCALDSFKVVLNAVEDDGALFNIDSDDKQCSLTIDFDYLFKMDCQNLVNILNPAMNTNADPKLLDEITNRQNFLEKVKVACSTKSSEIELKSIEFSNTNYSVIACGTNDLYCIQEGEGLTQWSNILGPARYNRFLNGDPNSYTCADWYNINNINNTFINSNKQPIIVKCDTPFGYKSNLKKQIDLLVTQQKACEADIDRMEGVLNDLLLQLDIPSTCATPIEALETLDVSMTLELVESDGSLTSVFESELFPAIGVGNLYTYLKEHSFDSGFYLCGEPKPTELWASGCTVLKYNDELTGPAVPFAFDCGDRELLGVPADWHCNVESCMVVKDAFLKGLYGQSGLSNSTTDRNTFKASLSKDIFASKWLNFSTVIDDANVLDLIKNKKIKLSLKVNNTCANVCIYIDSIKLIRNCVDGNGKSVLISESPGFQLDRIIDNKKSWIRNSKPVNRTFDIANNEGGNIIRRTDYDVNDERLVINTKEIDLDINIASAIENDLQCYINDNLDLLDGTPSTECGCEYECYKDVFKIITHAEAVAISPWVPTDPEDIMTSVRAKRDAWIKAWNELILATAPYLDIKNGVYHPNPSEDTMGTYMATRDAWRKALKEFNMAAGSGYIDYLTIDGLLAFNEVSDYETKTYSSHEALAPQIFNTKCGKIMIHGGTWAADPTSEGGDAVDGRFYIVETPENEVKLYLTNSYPGLEKTWIDITNLVQEEYPSDWLAPSTCAIPEKPTYYCKYILPGNYTSWAEMMSFHYQTNNNTSHNAWINSVDNSFFIGWDTAKNKCVTKKFKQSVHEEFSMNYPIISKSFWTTASSNLLGCSEACLVDYYLRNSGTTNCNTCNQPPDWSFPESMADELSGMNRAYRDATLKLANETHLRENDVTYRVNILDPNTNMPPDETGGYIPVHVTTTIRKGSRDGDIVFQEEYILNDVTAPCFTRRENNTSRGGLRKLTVYVGITDPNCVYVNPASVGCDKYIYCTDNGTYITGSTSTLPLIGASSNGIDRNWTFDEDYYIHFDVVNNNTGEIYYVTNNDYNLRDRLLPIKCPSSASTQTFDINLALNSINTFKTTILGEIQEDLDWALDACVINCNCEPNCDEDLNTYITLVDFMDDLSAIPTAEEIISVGSGSKCGCDYTSPSTVAQSYSDFCNTIVNDIADLRNNIEDFNNSLSAYTASKNIGFCDNVLTQPDITLISGHTFPNNYFYKGNPYKIKGYTPCKASLLSGWTTNNVAVKLSAYTDDITYLKAVSTVGALPVNGSAGNVIVVGTPSSYVGYAWDPTTNNWSTSFYNDMGNIFNDIENKRKTFIDAKEQLLLSMRPFTWANNYLPLHSIRLWALPEAQWVSGDQIMSTSGAFSPCPYKITTETCALLPYCGPYKHVYNNLC